MKIMKHVFASAETKKNKFNTINLIEFNRFKGETQSVQVFLVWTAVIINTIIISSSSNRNVPHFKQRLIH